MAQPTGPLPLMTMQEVAVYLGCSERTVKRYVANRSIPFLKVGRFIRFRPEDLDEWARQGCPKSNGPDAPGR